MADYLEYLIDDPKTRVIGGFIETVRSRTALLPRSIAPLHRASPWWR